MAVAAHGADKPIMPKSKFPVFRDVQANADFPAILRNYKIDAKSKGDELLCKCPFHDDKTPSMFVNPTKRVFKCFGCGVGGNALEFVRLKEGFDDSREGLSQAAEIVQSLSGTGSPELYKAPSKATSKPRGKDAKTSTHQTGTTPENEPLSFRLNLENGHKFLKSRGVDHALEDEFGLGLATRGTMRDRIVIPIHNQKGELVAYSGRYAGETLPEGQPRYKLPKKFNKSIELFNIHRAVKIDKDFIVLVEGFWSAIRLHSLGLPAVAAMGSHISEAQASMLANSKFDRVFIIMDGDEAGRLGAESAATKLAPHIFVRCLNLPDGEKPDTMGKEWIEVLK